MTTRRKFDWDEARRLRAEGMAYTEIAARFGVTDGAIRHAETYVHHPYQKPTNAERFWANVDVVIGDCWEWTGMRGVRGYGAMYATEGVTLRAHRVAYELMVGPIPDGLTIDHLCRNRACVNPLHLEPVTAAENTRRGRKTHCMRGHRLAGDNLYVLPNGSRCCKTCRAVRSREYRQRKARREQAA